METDMKLKLSCAVLALSTLLPTAALAQDTALPSSAPALSALLAEQSGGGTAYTADDLATILDPSATLATRGLKPGDGPAVPGAKGSGVVPDLRVHFATGSARLSPEASQQLAALAQAMQFPNLQTLRFEIAGHTDARGSAESNQMLSQRRARAVVEFLTESYDIAPDRLEAWGYGEARLADPMAPASGVNRRVEVRVD